MKHDGNLLSDGFSGIWAVYLREMMLLHRRSHRYIASMAVSPVLFMTAFSFAVGADTELGGGDYAVFLIPGLAAMNSMMQGFSIGSEINVARFYWKIFEEFQAAPLSDFSYALGESLAGATRGLISVAIIVLIGLPFGVFLDYGWLFWLAALLNAFIFAALGVCLAMIVKGHQDQMMLQTFLITPMAFLGGTFFPVERLPDWLGGIVGLLPLTHASKVMRSASFGEMPSGLSIFMLFIFAAISFLLAFRMVRKARD